MIEERRDEIIKLIIADPHSNSNERKRICEELFDEDNIEVLANIHHAVNKKHTEKTGSGSPIFLTRERVIVLKVQDSNAKTATDKVMAFAGVLEESGQCYVYSFWGRNRDLDSSKILHEDILLTVAVSIDGDTIYRIIQPFDVLGHSRIRWKEPCEKGYLSRDEISKDVSRFRREL